SGEQKKISSEPFYGLLKTLHHSWSPDSRWLVYTRSTATLLQQLWVYSLAQDRSRAVTDGLSDVSEPVFDAGGKYLFFAASTDAGPVRQWVAQSGDEMEMTSSLYLMVLAAGEPSPLARESDEETGTGGGAGEGTGAGEPGEVRVEIDFSNLDQRILALPLGSGAYFELQAGAPGKLYYLKSEQGFNAYIRAFIRRGETSLCRFDLERRGEETLAGSASSFILSADGKRILVGSDGSWLIAPTAGKIAPRAPRIATGAIAVRIDPRAEWAQIFDEAWRLNRDYFYDPGMHGADWPAMREKYAAFLPHLATRADLNRVVRWMGSELAVGHHRVGGGDSLAEPEPVPGGLLGADYEIDQGRYRFAKVYGGLNWTPELRSPLTGPGVEVEAGEYLLAVEGEDLKAPENLYRRFENTAGKIVEIAVGPHPDGRSSRTVKVVPIADEDFLRYHDWIEGNLKRVDEATDGRVAYVHVPSTGPFGQDYIKRYFFPQSHKQAIIVDDRGNPGGQAPDYLIDILRRPLVNYWAMRYGADLKTPLASIQGPKVMLIDETASSGGDYLPWMFRKLGLGPLVGRPTQGALVGNLGPLVLMDGGYVSAPNIAIWSEDGGFVVENVGVAPDIEVEQLPAEIAAGRDPQLEKAIEIVLEQLAAHPPKLPERPPYPVRARR
ncbi:MAG: peptidase S41, partial [bacterium]|nr:peptidase S41 [bacterium]